MSHLLLLPSAEGVEVPLAHLVAAVNGLRVSVLCVIFPGGKGLRPAPQSPGGLGLFEDIDPEALSLWCESGFTGRGVEQAAL